MGALTTAEAFGGLPDGRGYELVSPADKGGSDVIGDTSRTRVAAQESPALPAAVAFASLGAFADARGTGIATEYMAQRDGRPGTSGWATHAITPYQEPLSFLAATQSSEPAYEGDMSADLTTGVFRAWSPLTDAPNVAGVINLYTRNDLRSAGAGAYQLLSDAVTPLPPLAPSNQPMRPVLAGMSTDSRHVVFEDRENLTADASGGNVKLYKADDGVVRLVSDGSGICPGGRTATAPCSAAGFGATSQHITPHVISADGSRVTFTAPVNGQGLATASSLLYQLDDRGTADPADDAVVQLAPQAATYQTASTDGSRVFFTSTAQLTSAPGGGLYMWERQPSNESQSVTLDATGGTFTLTATTGPLSATTTPLAVDASAAQVQAALEALRPIGTGNVLVSGGPGTAAPYTVTFVGALAGVDVAPLTADGSGLTGGAGTADVAVTVPVNNLTLIGPGAAGVLGASDDGHRVYFSEFATQLVPGAPALSQYGIFLWQDANGTPSLSFVGAVTSTDAVVPLNPNQLWTLTRLRARVTPDGRHLAFMTTTGDGLAPGYQHCSGINCTELYVYSADDSTPTSPDVVCASCDLSTPGAPYQTLMDVSVGLGVSQLTSHQNRVITDDGRHVFFSSSQPLVPEDVNGRFDAYEWAADGTPGCEQANGCVSLLSSGTDASDSYYMDASADGDDAYIYTRQRLVGWDVDSAYDIYDVRVNGGFPDPPAPPRQCAAGECQGGAPAAPPLAPIGSDAFTGLGNFPVAAPAPKPRGKPKPKPLRCKRGQVKKRVHGRVRCVRKPAPRAKRARRAGVRGGHR